MTNRLGSTLGIFFLSFSIISLQLALMRSLSFLKYYHFYYLVISCALLGFGASGTLLSFAAGRFSKTPEKWIVRFYCLFALSAFLGIFFSQVLPIDVQYLVYSFQETAKFFCYVLLIFIPFFFGGLTLGLWFAGFRKDVPELYGTNMIGSGAGAVLTLFLFSLLEPGTAPLKISSIAAAGCMIYLVCKLKKIKKDSPRLVWWAGTACIGLCFSAWFLTLEIKPDQYKQISFFQRLEHQGLAQKVAYNFNALSRFDVYSSDSSHQTMFAGPSAPVNPPPQLTVLSDGNYGGTVYRISTHEEAEILEYTPQSIVYKLSAKNSKNPNVLLLGERGGTNIWLSLRYNPRSVTAVHADKRVTSLMEDFFLGYQEIVRFIAADPRTYIETLAEEEFFSVIQFSNAEGMPAVEGGLFGLHEDYLLTKEAVITAFSRLEDTGFLSITTGIQNPPKDTLKIFRLVSSALRESGKNPGEHILTGRNYLASVTLVSKEPLSGDTILLFQEECRDILIDPEYYPGIDLQKAEYINQPFETTGEGVSFLRYGAGEIAEGRGEAFAETYIFNLDVPEDNSPYFHNFFRFRGTKTLIDAYGAYWFQRMELGFLLVLVTLGMVVFAGFLIILLPLLAGNRIKRGSVFFFSIGFGFMFIEMVLIQKFTLFLGVPLYSAGAVLGGILVFSGAGSMSFSRISLHPAKRIFLGFCILCLVLVIYSVFLNRIFSAGFALSLRLRFFIALCLIGLPAYFMGWFFPSGLALYSEDLPENIGTAWGINGFASVAASPLAVILSMIFGFQAVLFIALALYCVSAVFSLVQK